MDTFKTSISKNVMKHLKCNTFGSFILVFRFVSTLYSPLDSQLGERVKHTSIWLVMLSVALHSLHHMKLNWTSLSSTILFSTYWMWNPFFFFTPLFSSEFEFSCLFRVKCRSNWSTVLYVFHKQTRFHVYLSFSHSYHSSNTKRIQSAVWCTSKSFWSSAFFIFGCSFI